MTEVLATMIFPLGSLHWFYTNVVLIEPVMPQEAILGLHFEAFASQAHIHFLQNLHRVTPVKNEIRKMKEDLKDLKELNPLTLDHNGCGAPPLSHYLPL